jgi:hypothetical protein
VDPQYFCCTTLRDVIFVELSSISVISTTCVLQHAVVCWVTARITLGFCPGPAIDPTHGTRCKESPLNSPPARGEPEMPSRRMRVNHRPTSTIETGAVRRRSRRRRRLGAQHRDILNRDRRPLLHQRRQTVLPGGIIIA